MDEVYFRSAVRRIERIKIGLGISGFIVVWGFYTVQHAVSFAAGTIIAYLTFLMIKRMANSLGGQDATAPEKPRAASAIGMGLRYFFIGLALFAIMHFTGISLWPVFAGLMTTVAAVTAEIIYEIITAT